MKKLKQNKEFASPENAEQELLKFCESVEFEIIDIDENDTQYFVDVNGDVVAAFFGTALADQQIYSRLKKRITSLLLLLVIMVIVVHVV